MGNNQGTEILYERFEVIKRLSAGNMGQVFVVKDKKRADEIVALKVLNEQEVSADSLSKESKETLELRFRDEMEICLKVVNPNVIKSYELMRLDDDLMYTMEFVDGINLADLYDSSLIEKDVQYEAWGYVAKEILKGLKAIHSFNVVHRDLKPSNILIDTKDSHDYKMWTVKISDLGLAKNIRNHAKRTAPMVRHGSMDYMSPEYYANSTLTVKHDIFSFGILLFEMLTKKKLRVMNQMPTGEIEFKDVDEKLLKGLPEKYKYIIRKCTHINPLIRYDSVDDVISDFNRPDELFEKKKPKSAYTTWLNFELLFRPPAIAAVLVVLILACIGIPYLF